MNQQTNHKDIMILPNAFLVFHVLEQMQAKDFSD